MASGYGALAGFGSGLSQVGQGMWQDQLARERERMLRDRQSELLQERAALNAGSGPGSGSGPGPAGGSKSAAGALLEMLQMPAGDRTRAQIELGGMDPERARDLQAIQSGQMPSTTVLRDMSTPGAVRALDRGEAVPMSVPKYTPGEASKLREEGVNALRRAVGIAQPANADDLAKAAQTEQAVEFARRGASGDVEGLRGSLLSHGKPVFSDSGTDLATGALAKPNAKLNVNAIGDLNKAHAEKLTSTLNSINNLIRTYDEKSLDDSEIKARRELQAMARQIANELSSRGLGPAGGNRGPAPKSAAIEAPRDPAKRVIGQRYLTPKGELIWRGNGWERP